MAERVAIVTDSSAAIPKVWATKLGVGIVPQRVRIGDTELDEDRADREQLVAALRANVPVSSAAAPPPAFYWVYQDAVAAGADAIVSVHISSGVSRTCEHAWEAAQQISVPVHIVDSRSANMMLGYAALAGAEAARAGAGVDEVLRAVRKRCQQGSLLLYVDSLEHLRRGGRIGRAQAWLGMALAIKPLLTLEDGVITPLEKISGTNRALNRLAELAVRHAGGRMVDLAVEYYDSPDRARALAEQLRARLPVRAVHVGPGSAAVGINLGPDALSLAVSPV